MSEQQDPIKVMVVDDHPMWRDAVARDLSESGFEVVATAGDGEQAVRRAKAAAPDVLVLDLNLPAKPGVQVCKELVGHNPALRVLVLSASGEHADVLEAVKSGATGYLLKSASTEELLDAVRRTAVGAFGLDVARTLDELEESFEALDIAAAARGAFPTHELDDVQAAMVRVGKKLPIELPAPGPVAVFAPDGEFLALYERAGNRPGDLARPIAVFV